MERRREEGWKEGVKKDKGTEGKRERMREGMGAINVRKMGKKKGRRWKEML